MAIGNFNPTIWSLGFQANLNKAHVHVNFLNRDYEGEIRAHTVNGLMCYGTPKQMAGWALQTHSGMSDVGGGGGKTRLGKNQPKRWSNG